MADSSLATPGKRRSSSLHGRGCCRDPRKCQIPCAWPGRGDVAHFGFHHWTRDHSRRLQSYGLISSCCFPRISDEELPVSNSIAPGFTSSRCVVSFHEATEDALI